MSLPGLMGRRAKKRFFMFTWTRLMYFKSNSVTSKLHGNVDIDSRTVITFPKGGKDANALQLARTDDDGKTCAILLLFDTSANMKGWELGIESSIHMPDFRIAAPSTCESELKSPGK
jgi:hypothetical protein